MSVSLSQHPYGEWPARHARIGNVELGSAMLAVKGVDGDHAVLIGSCPPGDYSGTYDCSAEAAGYHWSFRGSVFDQHKMAQQIRLWVRAEGELAVRPIPNPPDPVGGEAT
jgi:hypothetical protein